MSGRIDSTMRTSTAAAPSPTCTTNSTTGVRPWFWARFLVLFAILLLAHGWAIGDGSVLDDHWHQKGLREHGWSYGEILRTLNITPADFSHAWWQTKQVCWDYLRPLFILLMKIVYVVIGNNNPVALHVCGIVLHLVSAALVWQLCRLVTRDERWSFLGAVLFVVYPHSGITVAWPSSLNVVMQTALVLGALLAYARASRLTVSPQLESPHPATAPPISIPWFALCFFLWLLSLSTRENAVLMPGIFLAFDLVYGGRRQVWARRGVYILFFVIGVAFAIWRISAHIAPLPDVYFRRPSDNYLEYAGWLVAKLLHYVTASVWLAPMSAGPTGRYNPWIESPGDCALMIAIIGALGGCYFAAARRVRGWWIWPLWIVLFLLPILPVVATPHSGYMSGAAYAVACAVALCGAFRSQRRVLARFTFGGVFVLMLGSAFLCAANRLQWEAIKASERYFGGWVKISPPPREATDVFCINLPFVNVYAKPMLDRQLGAPFAGKRFHVLTYAPYIMEMDRPTYVEQVDANSFTVEIEGQAYFSRLLGRFHLEGFRGPGLFKTGEVIRGEDFDVGIERADGEGVWKLRFTFPRPLDDPRYCFYLTSKTCGAMRVRFGDRPLAKVRPYDLPDLQTARAMLDGGHARAAAFLFDAVEGGSEKEAAGLLVPVCRTMAIAKGAAVQPLLAKDDLSIAEWRQVRSWWAAAVSDAELAEVWLHQDDFNAERWLRSEIEWERFLADFVFQSDLYLTGPPFSNPRGRM